MIGSAEGRICIEFHHIKSPETSVLRTETQGRDGEGLTHWTFLLDRSRRHKYFTFTSSSGLNRQHSYLTQL